jgi:hypothetical protein
MTAGNEHDTAPRPLDDAAGRGRAFDATRRGRLYGPAVAAKRGLHRGGGPEDPIIPGDPYWVPLGPSVLSNRLLVETGPSAAWSGRITALRVAPGGQRAYAGTANGGVWVTGDGGLTWAPLDDGSDSPARDLEVEANSLAVGALDVLFGPSTGGDVTGDVVFAGTGCQTITNLSNTQQSSASDIEYFGVGVLRYTWSGATATGVLEGGDVFAGTAFGGLLAATDGSGDAWAGTSTGFFVRDGATATWSAPPAPPSAGTSVVTGIAVAGSGAALRVYVAYLDEAVYVFNPATGTFLSSSIGSLTGSTGRRILVAAATDAAGSTVYALNGDGVLWRMGPSASALVEVESAPDHAAMFEFAGQGGDLALALAIEPGTTDTVWVAGSATTAGGQLSLYRGEVVEDASGTPQFGYAGNGPADPTYRGTGIHADSHAIAFPPDASSAWVGCDGGCWVAPAPFDADGQFVAHNVGLAITQLTYLAQHPGTDAVVYAGTQDNGHNRFSGTASWDHDAGGDGGGTAVNPLSPAEVVGQVMYTSLASISSPYDVFAGAPSPPTTVGDAGMFTSPIAVCAVSATSDFPAPHPLLVFGADALYVSEGGGADWAQTWTDISGQLTGYSQSGVISVAAATVVATASDPEVVKAYASTTDGTVIGYQRVTGQSQWTALTIPNPGVANGAYIASLALVDATAGSLYATLAGESDDRVMYFDGAVWHTMALEVAGTAIDVPAHAVAFAPAPLPPVVYVGTDVGVFSSPHDGTTWTWTAINEGLPECAVTDLQVHVRTQLLRAATHGRGAWEIPLSPTIAQPQTEVYMRANPADTGRIVGGGRYPWIEGAPDPSQPPTDPANPQNGPLTYHWMSPDVKAIVTPAGAPALTYLDFNDAPDPIDPGTGMEAVDPTANQDLLAQVHNRGPQSTTSVRVALLIASAAGGLPLLDDGDYASGLASGDDSWIGGWIALPPQWYQDIASSSGPLEQRRPLVASWPNLLFSNLGLPATSDHYCLAAFVSAPDDPRVPTVNQSVDQLAMLDPHVGQRNLHLVTGSGAAQRHIGNWPRTVIIDFWNAARGDGVVELEFISDGFEGELSLVMSSLNDGRAMRTTGLDEVALGTAPDPIADHWERWAREVRRVREDPDPAREALKRCEDSQREFAELQLTRRVAQLAELDLDRIWITPAMRPGSASVFHDVKLPRHGRAVAALTIMPTTVDRERPARLHVVQRSGASIVGGSTFLIA